MEQQYYLLSIKHSDGRGNCIWWGPNNSGYTADLMQAGIYTETEIHSQPVYYSNKGVMPVEVEKVLGLPKRLIIPNEFAKELKIREFIKTAKEY